MTGHTTQPPRRAGHKHPSLAPAAALFLGSALAAVAAGGVDLTLADPSPDAPPPLADTATVTPAADATWLVHGRLSGAGFAVARPGQVRVTDGAGEPLPLVVETQVQKILYHTRPLFALLRDCPNVRVELSNFAGQGFLEYAVREYGAARLLYGSFLPMSDPWVPMGLVLDADIGDAEKALIAGGNLRRLVREVAA